MHFSALRPGHLLAKCQRLDLPPLSSCIPGPDRATRKLKDKLESSKILSIVVQLLIWLEKDFFIPKALNPWLSDPAEWYN